MKKLLTIFMLSLFTLQSYASTPRIVPTFKNVKLQEFTSMQLSVFPDAGTQLIFPFALDNPDFKPKFKIRLTNDNGFYVPTAADELKSLIVGQNTITILGLVNPAQTNAKYVSNLFINIGGYNLSIVLKTTLNPSEHVSNIVFDIDGKTRDHMIESAVKRRTQELEKLYKQKFDAIEETAKSKSLKHIAQMAKREKQILSFKEPRDIIIEDKRIELYADKLVAYGEFKILLFELKNSSTSDFTIESLNLVAKKESGIEETLQGAFDCNNRLNSDKTIKCTFSTLSSNIDNALRLQLKIMTDRGEGSAVW